MLTATPPAAPAAAAPPAATPPAAAATPPAAAAAAATPTAAAAPAPAASLVEGQLDIPDKFKVASADGKVDFEQTLRKVLPSVAHLEKRLGSGDVPPESEAGYKLDYSAFPEGIKITPDGEKAFLKSMHSAGLTNKQVQAVVNKYAEVIKAGQEIQKQQEVTRVNEVLDGVKTELTMAWGENTAANMTAVQRAFAHLADETDKADLKKIGKDAKVTYRTLIKVLAKVGAGLTEDQQVLPGEAVVLTETLQQLKSSKAYTDATDPAHEETVKKVTAMYAKLYPKK